MNKYTDEELLEILRKANEKCNGKLSVMKYRELGWVPSDVTITRRFGTWSKALEKAGIENENKKYSVSYTKEEIIDLLKKYYKENGHLTLDLYKQKKYKPSAKNIRMKFGSWNNALKEAGLPLNFELRQKYTKEDVISCLKKISNDDGTITVKEYKKKFTNPSYDTVVSLFGSWNEAVKAAGLTEGNKFYTDEEMLQSLREFIKETGYTSAKKYSESKRLPGSSAIINRFGGWRNAVKKALENKNL